LVHIVIDRARQFTSGDLRDEKLVSLGKLAAGLAHELNTPASAVMRSSKILIESLSSAEDASRLLASAGLTPAQFAPIDKARAMCVHIAVEIPDDVPRVHAVGAELNQVWMNLLDNAIDAVDKGGHVTVRASRERERVVVGIIDDGPGVPKEIQGRIFDPFF